MTGFLEKSYLFEIVNKADQEILESFTLVIPPESVRVKEPQRVSIQKTFGNAIVDDYGPDNIEITIAGKSGTARAFPTFRSDHLGAASPARAFQSIQEGEGVSSEGYNHRAAFYTFRDEIMRYKERFENFEDKELRVYDLGDEQAYKCVLLEFDLDRSAQNPMQYPYTISLFAYERMDSAAAREPDAVDISRNPEDALQDIEDTNQAVDDSGILDRVRELRADSNAILQQADLMSARLATAGREVLSAVESPLNTAKQLVETIKSSKRRVEDLFGQLRISAFDYAWFNESLNSMLRNAYGVYGYAVSEGRQRERRETIPLADVLAPSTLYSGVAALAPSARGQTFSYTRVKAVVVKEGDTLQKLAVNHLGDPDLWVYIASLNEFTSDDDLVAGERIFVPAQESVTTAFSAYILSEEHTDHYGSDFALDDRFRLRVGSDGDYSVVRDIQNVVQAIDLRLNTRIGTMMRHTAYGISAISGRAATALAVSYVRTSFRSTLFQDPRVADVRNVGVVLQKDRIRVNGNVHIFGSDDTIPVEEVL